MDRRQQKTRKAIFSAFRNLLERKRYEHITVQDIIDQADVGRSTFYSHFETKELLLDAMCNEMFNHIFEDDPCPWVGENDELEGKLAHILWHVRDSKNDLTGILLSDSGEIFMKYFKAHLRKVFLVHISYFNISVPREFLLKTLVGGFSEAVMWWMHEGMITSPEETARYFMQTIGK